MESALKTCNFRKSSLSEHLIVVDKSTFFQQINFSSHKMLCVVCLFICLFVYLFLVVFLSPVGSMLGTQLKFYFYFFFFFFDHFLFLWCGGLINFPKQIFLIVFDLRSVNYQSVINWLLNIITPCKSNKIPPIFIAATHADHFSSFSGSILEHLCLFFFLLLLSILFELFFVFVSFNA